MDDRKDMVYPGDEIVVPPPKSITTTGQKKTMAEEFNPEISKLIPQAGTLELTQEQEDILYAEIEDEDIEIRPDGLIFLPWHWYEGRMRKAFGSKWTMIPAGQQMKEGNLIMQPWWLIIDGKPYGWAIGEQNYIENNPLMTYGSAIEAAKSNALMRLCKGMGIGTKLWNQTFIKTWKDKYAEKYWDEEAWNYKKKKYGAYRWKKKGTTTIPEHIGEKPTVAEKNANQTSNDNDIMTKMDNTMTPKEIKYALNTKHNISTQDIEGEISHRMRIYAVYGKGLKGDRRLNPQIMHYIREVERHSDKHGVYDAKAIGYYYSWQDCKDKQLLNDRWRNLTSDKKENEMKSYVDSEMIKV